MRFAPTAAWARGTIAAVVLITLGVLFGRTPLVVLGAPFVVWSAWALVHAPRGPVSLTTNPKGRISAPEGTAIPLGIGTDAEEPVIVTAAWPDVAGATFDPAYAATTDMVAEGEEAVVVANARRWGLVGLGPARVAVSDRSGAWRAQGLSAGVRATFRPESGTLHGPTGVARPIGISGVHASSRRGDGTTLSDIRPFQMGDRLRRINWRVTSRTGQLHTTSTLTDRDTDVLVVADSIHDINGPDVEGPTTFDTTVRAVVAISRYYADLGDRVALSDVGARIRSVRAGTGLRQARIIADVLSQSTRGTTATEFRRRVPRITPGTLVFVCSPLLEPKAVQEVVRFRRMGGEVVVVDTLPEAMGEKALDFPHPLSVSAEAWHVRYLERQNDIDALRSAGIPVTAWRGPTSLAAVLLAMEAARQAPRLGGAR